MLHARASRRERRPDAYKPSTTKLLMLDRVAVHEQKRARWHTNALSHGHVWVEEEQRVVEISIGHEATRQRLSTPSSILRRRRTLDQLEGQCMEVYRVSCNADK